jgi:anti-sigma factor RsiW
MQHDGFHELTAAYALNALDEAEASEYEAHLGRCQLCQEELASLQDTVTSLAYLPEAPAPPRALRSRILTEARTERAPAVAQRPRWTFPVLAGATAVATIGAIALGIWAASLSSSLADERQTRAEQNRAFAVLGESDAVRIPLKGAEGVLVLSRTGDAALVVSNLDPAPSGKAYEAWVIENERSRPAALFDAGDGRTVVALDRPVPGEAVVAVTLEDDEGADQPSGAPVFTATAA